MYGQYMLDHVYLAFRKINGDSSLCMLHFSSTGIRFTVHEIFVECPGEPVLSSVEMVDPQVQPNPCTDWIQVTGSVWESLELLDIRGQLIRKESNVQWINTEELSPGIYFLKLKDGTAREQTLRFIKAL